MSKNEYINGGINKNTYELLFKDDTVDKSERQGVEQLKAWNTLQEYTLQQQKGIFCNLLKLANIVNPVDYGKVVYDKKTKEYKYSHNGIDYIFDMISRYVAEPEVKKILLSKDRYGECNKGSLILSKKMEGSKIATGYIIVADYKVLHSVVLFNDSKKGLLVFDWAENLIMPFDQYKDMLNFNILSTVDGEKIEPDFKKLEGIGIDTKSYLTFRDELMHDTERNEEIFRK